MTTEEIVLAAATGVAILMQPRLEEDDEVEFVELFMKETSELLETKGKLFIGFGPGVAKDAFFTEDMQAIMQFVEENTKKKYSFRNGRLLMYLGKEQSTAIWEDD